MTDLALPLKPSGLAECPRIEASAVFCLAEVAVPLKPHLKSENATFATQHFNL
ncbi:hypothetical protein H6F86_03330 [Phormidium sp. FACHB-592]|uniref:Uncharacterized protein n=1 Tax=Stenomitos frigidus AS-A4 TaxID=2933935 RepID=A0ABV0KRA1_9CYAN|nr:hypothetical protein [Phormidium sp. FACHB-592]MBD2072931.1 hypothetical protein [Phormidium sp. FACHB-592]